MSDARKFYSNTVWMVFGRVFASLVTFLVGVFVVRHLGVERYGILMYCHGVIGLFSFVSAAGLDAVLVREFVRGPDRQGRLLGSSLMVRLVASAVSMLCVAALLGLTGADARTWLLCLLLSSTYIFRAAEGVRSLFEARLAGKYTVVADLAQSLLCGGIRIALVCMGMGLSWFAMTLALESALSIAVLLFFYKVRIDTIKSWKFDPAVSRELLRAGAPLVLSALAITLYNQIDKVMLKHMLFAEGSAQVGLYTVALRIVPFVSLVPTMLARSLFPAIVSSRGSNPLNLQRRTQIYLDLMLWVGVLLSAVLFIAAKPIVRMYGAEFSQSAGILQVVAWKGIFIASSIATGSVIVAQNLQRFAALRNLAGALVNIVLNWLLISRFKASGAAWATVLSLAVSSFAVHGLIPAYRPIFRQQVKSVFGGPVRLWRHGRILMERVFRR